MTALNNGPCGAVWGRAGASTGQGELGVTPAGGAGRRTGSQAADLEPFRAHLARRRAADRRTLLRRCTPPGCGGCSTTRRASCPR